MGKKIEMNVSECLLPFSSVFLHHARHEVKGEVNLSNKCCKSGPNASGLGS